MKKTIFTGIFVMLLASLGFGQGFQFDVAIKDFKGDSLVLAFRLGEKNYIKDTMAVQPGGRAVFKGDTTLEGGIYMILMPPDNKFFEFLVSKDEQHFSMETSGPDYVENMKIKGSKDNDIYYDYMRFLGSMNKKAIPLRKTMDDLKDKKDSDEYKKAEADLKTLDVEVKAKQTEITTKYAKSLSAKLILCNTPVDIPEPPAEIKGDATKEQEFRYRYYRKHYFDGFDWSDERLVRTPFLEQKMMFYLEKLTVINPDSAAVACDEIMEMARKNKEVYKYCGSTLLNFYAASKIICMDGTYVHIADKYYCNKTAPYGGAFWVNEEQLGKICENANRLRGVRCQQLAPNLILNKLDGTPIELHKVKAEYTVVYFWDPDCGNCKKQSQRFVELYDKLKGLGVEIFGICSKTYQEFDKCQKKVDEMGIKWISVGDPYMQARAKQLYDIQMTPFIYLLDKDKKILYKRIDPDQLVDIVEKDLQRKEQEKLKGNH